MQFCRTRKAISIFLAVVLVFTCNSATYQPLIALAESADAEQSNSAAVPLGAENGLASDATIPTLGDNAAGVPSGDADGEGNASADPSLPGLDVTPTPTPQPDDPQAPVPAPDPKPGDTPETPTTPEKPNPDKPSTPDPRDPIDVTEQLDALAIELVAATFVDAEGTIVRLEAKEGHLDASSFDPQTCTDMQLEYKTTLQPGVVLAGDTFKLKVPAANFTLGDTERVQKANAADAARVGYAVLEHTVTGTFTEAVEKESAPTVLTVRVPVDVLVESLGVEPQTVELALQAKAKATIVLPAKPVEKAKEEAPVVVPLATPVAPEVKAATTAATPLEKEWRDNNDAARPSDKIATDGTLSVYFTVGGVETQLTDETREQLGLTAVPTIVAAASGTSHTKYTCEDLPSVDEAGDAVTYVIKEDADKAKALGYLQQELANGTLCNVKTKAFTATVVMHDGVSTVDPSTLNLNPTLLLVDKADTVVDVEKSTWTGPNASGAYTYTIPNLPAYDLETGKPLDYHVILSAPSKPGEDYYLSEYNNEKVPNYGPETDSCYEGGTINLTLAGSTTYAGTKAWLDNGADPKDRPAGKFYLWRYTDKAGNGYKQASQVRDDGGKLATLDLDTAQNTYDFTLGTDTSAFKTGLPKYDSEGYPYVYFVREMLEGPNADNYEQVFGAVTDNGDGTFTTKDTLPDAAGTRDGSDRSLYNGGTLSNRLTGSVTTSTQKTWKAPAYQNQIADVTVTLTLQSRPAGSADDKAWRDTSTTKALTGFNAEFMTLPAEASASQYDELGRELEYRWVESSVTQGGENLLQPDGTFTLACNDASNVAGSTVPEKFVSSVEKIGGKDTIVNRIKGTVDYTIDKLWKQSDGKYGKEAPKGAAITVGIYQNGTLMPERQYTMDGVRDKIEPDAYHIYIDDLPKYNEEGRLYSYVAEEVTGYGTWHSTYSYDVANRTTDIKNDPTGPGNMIRVGKTWIDDDDVDHRYPVVVEVYKDDGIDNSYTGDPVATVTLNRENNWWTWVGADEGTTYSDYELKETQLVKSATEVFAPKVSATTGGITTVTTDKHIYQVSYGQNDGLHMLTVTNKRIGVIDLTVTKNWVDSGNEANRPGANLKLVCVEYPDAVDYTKNVVTVPGGGTLPILDGVGKPASATQVVASGDKDTISTYEFFNLPKYDKTGKVIHYTVAEEPVNADAFSKADYGITVNQKDYDIGGTHTDDKQSVEVVNQRVATKEVQFNKEWLDAYAFDNGKRPDIYLTFWQQSGAGTPEKVGGTGFKDYRWEARVDGSSKPIDAQNQWTATVKNLPKYDATTGAEITYYAEESTNVDAKVFDYTPVSYVGDTISAKDGERDATVLKESGTFVNAIENNVVIDGEKFWKNLPSGFPSAQLPPISVHIDQKLGDTVVQKNIAELTGLTTPADTNDFTFSIDKAGSNNPTGGAELPKYNDAGKLYSYWVSEVIEGTPSGGADWELIYEKNSAAFTLDNVFKIDDTNLGTLSVTKTWADRGTSDMYPEVTFELYRQYVKTDGSVSSTVSEKVDTKVLKAKQTAPRSDTVTFDKQLVLAPDGQKYTYVVKEAAINGYTTDLAASTAQELNTTTSVDVPFKNTYDKRGTVSLEGEKVWVDYDNAFGIRPADLDIMLSRSAEAQKGANNAVSSQGVDLNDTNLTWDKATDPGSWTYTITGLEKYAPNGMPWIYEVVEDLPLDCGYEATWDSAENSAAEADAITGVVAMDALENELSTTVKVKKEWSDNDNEYKLRPASVQVKLQVKVGAVGTWQDAKDVLGGKMPKTYKFEPVLKGSSWAASFSNLPSKITTTNGVKACQYRVVETKIGSTEGITVADDGTYTVGEHSNYLPTGVVNGLSTTITNTMRTNGQASLTVKKIWVDSENIYDTRPLKGADTKNWQVTVKLQRSVDSGLTWVDVVETGSTKVVTRTISDAIGTNEKKETFDRLPKFNEAGDEYDYRAVEMKGADEGAPTGYLVTYAADSSTDANATTMTNSLDTTNVEGTKSWVDASNASGKRPASGDVQLALYQQVANGQKTLVPGVQGLVWSNDAADTWSYAFAEDVLPKCDRNGNNYTYTVEESPVPAGYWVAYDKDNRTVTNTQTAFKLNKVDEADASLKDDKLELSVYKKDAEAAGQELLTWKRAADGTVAIAVKDTTSSLAVSGDTILGLPVGDYVLKETGTPDAYVTAANIDFTLKADGTIASGAVSGSLASGIVVTMKDRLAKAQVELTKTIEGGKAGTVEGVEFSLFKGSPDTGTLLAEGLATNVGGVWTSKDSKVERLDNKELLGAGLEVGDYYFVETKATHDTVLDATPRTFSVTNANDFANTNTPIKVGVANRSFAASLELAKLDGTSGEALAGAAFSLSYTPEGGTTAQTIEVPAVQDKTGAYKAVGLGKGEYTLTEIAPNGYADPFKATFKLTEADNGKIVLAKDGLTDPAVAVTKTAGTWTKDGVTNTRISGSLTLTKQNNDDTLLAGTEFTLVDPGGKSQVYTTGADGKIVVTPLAWGTYTIQETKATDGYWPGVALPFEFQVGPVNGDVKLVWDRGVIKNAQTSISIAKQDASGNALAGATFTLTGDFVGDPASYTWTSLGSAPTEGNGLFTGKLIVGKEYELTETAPPQGYKLSADMPMTLRVTASGQAQYKDGTTWKDVASNKVVVNNDQNELKLIKRDVDDKALVGSKFTVTGTFAGATDEETRDLPITDSEGSMKGQLVAGSTYTITETVPPAGYQAVEPFEVSIDASGTASLVDSSRVDVTIGGNGASVVVKDTQNKISIAKQDSGTTFLAGAEFTLTGDFVSGSTPITWISLAEDPTDVAGLFTGKLIANNEYVLTETVPPQGYELSSSASMTLRITSAGQAQYKDGTTWTDVASNKVVVKNDQNELKLIKRDVGTKALTGSTFTVTPKDKASFADGTTAEKTLSLAEGTDKNEAVLAGQLVAGSTYTITETVPPAGYSVVKPFEVTIDKDGAVSLVDSSRADVTMDGSSVVVKDTQNEFKLSKTDSAGVALTGSTFTIKGTFANGTTEETRDLLTTGSEGSMTGQLVAGSTYTITETVPPAGYQVVDPFEVKINASGTASLVDSSRVDVTIGGNGASVVVKDTQNKISIAKQDSGTTFLAGAEFTLTGDFVSGSTPITWTSLAEDPTDVAGLFTGKLIANNEYVLTETVPPQGYELSSSASMTLRITTAGQAQYLEGATWKDVADNKVVVNNDQNEFKLIKRDVDNNALVGSKFTVTGMFAGATAEETRELPVTDSEGSMKGQLVAGSTYTITETVPPAGYSVVAPFKVKIDTLGAVSLVDSSRADVTMDGSSVVVKDSLTAFSLNKVDSGGKDISDDKLELAIYKADDTAYGSKLVTWKRAAPDKVSVDVEGPTMSVGTNNAILGLPAGDYVLKETGTPDAYVTAANIDFTLKTDGTITSSTTGTVSGDLANGIVVTMKDRLAYGQVELTKSIVDGKPGTVAGVEFNLYKGKPDNRKIVAEGLTTDSKGTWSSLTSNVQRKDRGRLLSAGLEVGDYLFVETKATPDTVLDSAMHVFSVTNEKDYKATNIAIPVGVKNKAFAASLELAKLDGTSGEALAGATFSLSYTPEGGTTAQTIEVPAVQDKTGAYKVDNLKKGSYTLTEGTVPSGYKQPFKATFTLKDADNGKTVLVKNDSTNAVTVNLKEGTWTSAGVTNTRMLGSLTLTKQGDDAALLEGTEFTLVRPDKTSQTYTTDGDGKISVDALAWGTYTLQETKATDGYQPGANVKPITFEVGPDSGTNVKLIWNYGTITNAQTDISIDKVNNATPTPVRLDGAHLKLTGTFVDATTEKTWTSSKDATEAFKKQLIVGETYTLEETDRLSEHLALPGKITFKLNDAGQIVLGENPKYADGSLAASLSTDGLLLSVRNVAIESSVELTKTGEDGSALAGVVFDLYQKGVGTPLKSGLTTDVAGKIAVYELLEGEYYFTETSTLAACLLDPTPIEFLVGPGEHAVSVPVSMQNKDFKTSVVLTKVDETDGTPLAGVEFTLSKQAADGTFAAVGDPVTSDSKGEVGFDITSKGKYQVQETKAAEGYELTDAPYTAEFTVDNTSDFQGKTLDLSEAGVVEQQAKYQLDVQNVAYKNGLVANIRQTGQVSLVKVDATTPDSTPINDVVFTLSDSKGTALGEFSTGKTYASVSDANPVVGAAGTLVIKGLVWDTYTLQETKAVGYVVPDTKHEFALGKNAEGVALSADLGTITNTQTELSFTKLSLYAEDCSDPLLGAVAPDAKQPLAGAGFTAYSDEACTTSVATAISGAAGQVTFKKLAAATYWVKETTTPAGHVPSTTVYQAVFKANGQLESFAEAGSSGILTEVVNDVYRADISIKKVAETDPSKTLPNSVYGLFKRGPVSPDPSASPARALFSFVARAAATDGLQLVAQATTDQSGMLTFKGVLMDQEYVIQELSAPDGSLVSKDPIAITFKVDESGAPRITSFDDGSGTAEVDANGNIVWKEPQVLVDFSKKDPEGNLLAGAKLQVIDKKGTPVGESWVSSASKPHRLDGILVAGATYALVEVEAPEGYVKAQNVLFTVENPKVGAGENYVQSVEMVDERVPTVPVVPATSKSPGNKSLIGAAGGTLSRTGDTPFGLVVGGMALCAAGIAGVATARRSRKR